MRNLIDQCIGQKIARVYSLLDTLTAFIIGKRRPNIRAVLLLAIQGTLLTWLYSQKTLTRASAKNVTLGVVQTATSPTLAEQLVERERQKIDDIIAHLDEKNVVHTPSEVERLVRLGYTSIDIYTLLYSLAKSRYAAATRQAILAGLNNKDLGLAKPFKTRNSLDRHAQEHSDEFGFITPDEYETLAIKFMSGPLVWHVMQLERQNGDYIRWNSHTGQFGVRFRDGRLKTYFLGKATEEGYKYFLEQHFRDDEEAQKKAGEQTGMRSERSCDQIRKYRWYHVAQSRVS